MLEKLKAAIKNQDEQGLINFLDNRQGHLTDNNYYNLIEQALLSTWHTQHEDLVNMIYLHNLIDDRFVEPILNIALNKERFRWYDDELEATLRKCVHVLKMIDSDASNKALKTLESLNNDNVNNVLEMYN